MKMIIVDIEDLTHKTGNYKQFGIFVNMLESALLKVSYSLVNISSKLFIDSLLDKH